MPDPLFKLTAEIVTEFPNGLSVGNFPYLENLPQVQGDVYALISKTKMMVVRFENGVQIAVTEPPDRPLDVAQPMIDKLSFKSIMTKEELGPDEGHAFNVMRLVMSRLYPNPRNLKWRVYGIVTARFHDISEVVLKIDNDLWDIVMQNLPPSVTRNPGGYPEYHMPFFRKAILGRDFGEQTPLLRNWTVLSPLTVTQELASTGSFALPTYDENAPMLPALWVSAAYPHIATGTIINFIFKLIPDSLQHLDPDFYLYSLSSLYHEMAYHLDADRQSFK